MLANFPQAVSVRCHPDSLLAGPLCYSVETGGVAREVNLFIGREQLGAGGASPVQGIVWAQLRWLGGVSPRARRADPSVETTFAYVACS